MKYLQQNGRKPTYIKGILKNIRSFLKYCVGEEYILKNQCKQVKWVKEKKVIINTFIDAEVKEILRDLNDNDYLSICNKCILAMLIDTGIETRKIIKRGIISLQAVDKISFLSLEGSTRY